LPLVGLIGRFVNFLRLSVVCKRVEGWVSIVRFVLCPVDGPIALRHRGAGRNDRSRSHPALDWQEIAGLRGKQFPVSGCPHG